MSEIPLQFWLTWSVFVLDLILRLVFCGRVLRRHLPVSVTWAWLVLILLFPFIGTILYLFLGEYRLGRRRERRLQAVALKLKELLRGEAQQTQENLPEPAKSLARMNQSLFQTPVAGGNEVKLVPDADAAFPLMIQDIDKSQKSCDMEFYIWSDGGRADEFGEALIRATSRGVKVRVLVDQVGSSSFIRGDMWKKLTAAGVELRAALPSGFVRALVARPDLRVHRKILVVDREVAYTGSLNLADPKFFKIKSHVGQWVDALCRIRGPAVKHLEMVFLADWHVESQSPIAPSELSFEQKISTQNVAVQCLPSGPAVKNSNIEQTLISTIYSARHRLLLTTPYFVPSEAMLYALTSAARRGVQVTLIVPRKVDSPLVHYAGRAFLRELSEAGVRVALYREGLLHTKSVTVDGELSLFGSLNLDSRSLRINFEITLAIFDQGFTKDLVALQERYLSKSDDLTERTQSSWAYFKEDLARLVSPLL